MIVYISLDFFRQQFQAKYKHLKDDWSGNENYLSISFVSGYRRAPEKCGGCLVYREDVKQRMMIGDSSRFTNTNRCF